MIFWHDYDEMAFKWSAKHLWRNAGMGPEDMDFAMLYDGFAPLVLYGLQEYGFVERGDAGHFLGDGEHLAGGRLPLKLHARPLASGQSFVRRRTARSGLSSVRTQASESYRACSSCVSLWRASRWIMGRLSSCDSLTLTLLDR